MAARAFSTLLEGGAYFESPRWHEGRWWVSDFYRATVSTVTTGGDEDVVLSVDGQPSGLAWMPDGSMLVVSMTDHRLLRRTADGTVTEHADLTEHCGGLLNDLVVDASGRAFVGEFGFDLMTTADPLTANLCRVDPDGAVAVAARDLYFPNGSVILPDERTLIVGETLGNRLTAFTIADDGELVDRRVWAQFAPTPALTTFAETFPNVKVAPDGCALDGDGHIWAADGVGGRCIRVAPGGAIVDEIAAPEGLGVFACALGGDDGRTLLGCAAPDFFEHSRRPVREAVLLTATVEASRAGRP